VASPLLKKSRSSVQTGQSSIKAVATIGQSETPRAEMRRRAST